MSKQYLIFFLKGSIMSSWYINYKIFYVTLHYLYKSCATTSGNTVVFQSFWIKGGCLKSAKCFTIILKQLCSRPVHHTVCNVLLLMIFKMEQILWSASNILMFP